VSEPDSADVQRADRADTIAALAEHLAQVIKASPPDARAWHHHGMADPAGFAAMACDELLVHGHDMAEGFGDGFEPRSPATHDCPPTGPGSAHQSGKGTATTGVPRAAGPLLVGLGHPTMGTPTLIPAWRRRFHGAPQSAGIASSSLD